LRNATGALLSCSPLQICIAQKTGMRISGPNFFGFSDITTQQALAMSLYNEQELQQALQVGCLGGWGCGGWGWGLG
jgi:hypothetical protein